MNVVNLHLLPLELVEKIFSHLTFQEIADLRKVSKGWKKCAELWLVTVKQLSINLDDDLPLEWREPRYRKTDPLNLILFSKSIKKTVYTDFCSSLLTFLSLYCPNLEVLDAERDVLPFNELCLLGSSLIYFAASNVDFGDTKLKAVDLLPLFPVLQAFDILSSLGQESFCPKVFHSNRDGQFIQWTHPCLHLSYRCDQDKQVLPAFAQSISYLLGSPLNLSEIEPPLAESLVIIEAVKVSCSAKYNPFPKLRFFESCASSSVNPVLSFLCKAPLLQRVVLRGKVDLNTPKVLSELVSCKQLKTLKFAGSNLPSGDGFEDCPLQLAPQLEHLNIRVIFPVTLNSGISSNLRNLKLEIPSLKQNYFECPNLRKFSLIFENLEPELSWLFESLANSPKLEVLQIKHQDIEMEYWIAEDDSRIDGDSLLALADLVQKLKHLVNLDVSFANLEGDDDILVDMALEFDLSTYPKLVNLVWNVPMDITLTFNNQFRRFAFCKQDRIEGFGKYICVKARQVVYCYFKPDMTKLKVVEFFSIDAFVSKGSLLSSCPNLQKVSIRLLSEVIGDEAKFKELSRTISTWPPTAKVSIEACFCTMKGFIKHLAKPCEPCPKGLLLVVKGCGHNPGKTQNRVATYGPFLMNLKFKGVVEECEVHTY